MSKSTMDPLVIPLQGDPTGLADVLTKVGYALLDAANTINPQDDPGEPCDAACGPVNECADAPRKLNEFEAMEALVDLLDHLSYGVQCRAILWAKERFNV